MPGVTDDRELTLPENGALDTDPAKLREYEFREPLATWLGPGQPPKDTHRG
jgi:hypothetical protein